MTDDVFERNYKEIPQNHSFTIDRQLPSVLFLFCLVLSILFAAGFFRILYNIYSSADYVEQIVTLIPDDAFYYLVLAKNYAQTGQWTFDGVAPATGFHLLWAYSLSLLYTIAPEISLETVYLISGVVSLLAFALSGALVSVRARREFGYGAPIPVVIAFLSPDALQLPLYIMETPIVVLCASILYYRLGTSKPDSSIFACGIAAFVAFIGMMGRSDFGLFPAAILAAHGVMMVSGRTPFRSAAAPAAALLGATIGLVVVLLHSYHVSGSYIQASAATKAYWSEVNGHDPIPSITLTIRTVAPGMLGGLIPRKIQSISVLLSISALTVAGFVAWKHNLRRVVITGAMMVCILLYTVFYSRNSGSVQPWYIANLLIPTAIILASVLQPMAQRHIKIAMLIVGIWSALGLVQSLRPQWTHQKTMREAGLFLAEHPEIAPVGTWNAGLVSFFADRPVVNLDGLVNDQVYEHLRSGTLLEYMLYRNIRYVVDFPAMFKGAEGLRGGYADGRLQQCLIPERPLAENAPANQWMNSIIQLYRFDRCCAQEVAHINIKTPE